MIICYLIYRFLKINFREDILFLGILPIGFLETILYLALMINLIL